MNIQQFQYVIAVEELRHFEKAAEKCFVTQSTLSTMISKLEDELGFKIFDRKKKPVEITAEGLQIIKQLKTVNKEISQLSELSKEIKGEIKGDISISAIPTVAPFLLPLFLQSFASKFPDLNIHVTEQTTAEILRQLKSRELDIGIISIPMSDKEIEEIELYDESFVFYDAAQNSKAAVSSSELDLSNLYLLEEGHCMRTQVLKLCELHKKQLKNKLNFEYKAGSIDSLLRFVKFNKASTLLPYLATTEFSPAEQKNLSQFNAPVPYRSVGLVVHRHFVKRRILEKLKEEILKSLKGHLPKGDIRGEMLSPA